MSTAKTTSLHRCSSSKFSEKEPLPHTNIKLFHRNHTTSQFSQVFWILLFRAFWPLPIFTSLNFGRHKKKFGFWIFTRWNQKDKTANHRCKRQNRGTFWPLPVLSMGWNHKAETANHTFKYQKQRITEGIMNTLVLLILVIASSLAAVKQRALQSKPSPAKMMNAMLFLL